MLRTIVVAGNVGFEEVRSAIPTGAMKMFSSGLFSPVISFLISMAALVPIMVWPGIMLETGGLEWQTRNSSLSVPITAICSGMLALIAFAASRILMAHSSLEA